MTFLLIGCLLVFAAVIVRVNIQYYRERARMTPEEREKADEDDRLDSQLW
jgi:hypothetical protein